jgi:ABC-type glutathione transport system ATPase component
MTASPEFVLEARGLSKTFTQGHWWQKRFRKCALDNVSLTLAANTTLAVVGKSGSGKTTLAMCLVGLERPDSGEIFLDGKSFEPSARRKTNSSRRDIQLIFQDSSSAMNPRMSAIQIVEEPLIVSRQYSRSKRGDWAEAMMQRVGISPNWRHRLPHEFSGGQRQRLAIARALVLKPRILILDEIFVGLDLSIQGQIANLLLEMQSCQGLSYICISHNVALVSQIADAIAVMDQGKIVLQGNTNEVLAGEYDVKTEQLASRMGRTPHSVGAYSGA